MSGDVKPSYEFGPFRLDLSEHVLLLDGQPLPLTPKIWLVNKLGREQRTLSLQGVHWSIGDIDWSPATELLTFVSTRLPGALYDLDDPARRQRSEEGADGRHGNYFRALGSSRGCHLLFLAAEPNGLAL